jgi:hypothetical protein
MDNVYLDLMISQTIIAECNVASQKGIVNAAIRGENASH